jgi:hypothetical protein
VVAKPIARPMTGVGCAGARGVVVAKVVGIDLGTTNSVVAATLEGGQAEVIPIFGQALHPAQVRVPRRARRRGERLQARALQRNARRRLGARPTVSGQARAPRDRLARPGPRMEHPCLTPRPRPGSGPTRRAPRGGSRSAGGTRAHPLARCPDPSRPGVGNRPAAAVCQGDGDGSGRTHA